MPWRSEAQRRWGHATHPEMAKRWDAETPKGLVLPERVHARATTSSVAKAAAARRLRRHGLRTEKRAKALVNKRTPFNVLTAENGAPVGFQSGLGHGNASPAKRRQ